MCNHTKGGEGSSGITEEESKIRSMRMKNRMTGVKKTLAHRTKISENSKNQDKSTQLKAMKLANIGKSRKEETKTKISNSNKGQKRDEETKNKQRIKQLSHAKIKCIYCLKHFLPAALGRFHGNNCKLK